MDGCTGQGNMTETMLKMVLNTIQAIIRFVISKRFPFGSVQNFVNWYLLYFPQPSSTETDNTLPVYCSYQWYGEFVKHTENVCM